MTNGAADGRFATYPSLKDCPVVVTGGATGIGRAIVEAFVEQGARVAFFDIDVAAGERLVADCASVSHQPVFISCDVTDTAALEHAIAATAGRFGGLKVLVNNAANDRRHALDDLTPELWDQTIAINLKHQLFASKAAYPLIAKQGGGSIICLGSIAWLNNTTGMIAYTTAKAGIHGLVRTLARQLGPLNIRVNALLPGWTMTDKQLALWVDADGEREIDRAQCLKARVMPVDIARMALFLAADDSRLVTQQALIVDGGWV